MNRVPCTLCPALCLALSALRCAPYTGLCPAQCPVLCPVLCPALCPALCPLPCVPFTVSFAALCPALCPALCLELCAMHCVLRPVPCTALCGRPVSSGWLSDINIHLSGLFMRAVTPCTVCPELHCALHCEPCTVPGPPLCSAMWAMPVRDG